MDWKIEVVQIPVSDIDRAKHFYSEQVGFQVDVDDSSSGAMRFVQLTPPGSGCSISLSSGFHTMAPGSMQGVQLVVDDVDAARTQLVERGVEVSPVRNFTNGAWCDGRGGPWNSFIFFSDPDGNSWVVQERPRG